MRFRALLIPLVAVAVLPLAGVQPASAVDPEPVDGTQIVAWEGRADVALYDATDTTVVARKAYVGDAYMDVDLSPLNAEPPATTDTASLDAFKSGIGGSSSASGCQRVTITNTGRNLLGSVAYRFKTWTHWCWNRGNHRVYDVQSGWNITDVDFTYDWQGIINRDLRFFAWISGYPRSGYINMRQGKFLNCAFKVGCFTGYSYPVNRLRSRSNGTFYWSTAGAVG